MGTFVIFALGITIGVFILYFIGTAIAPYNPSTIKNEHFECGLPASSEQPKKANFGFFVYAIMFVVADMTGLFFTLFVFNNSKESSIIASIFALILAIGVTVAMKEYKDAENS